MVAFKAFGLWLVILVLAIVNGGLRESVLSKLLPRSAAFAVSGLLLIACVLIVALASIEWLGRLSAAQYAGVGLMWLLNPIRSSSFAERERRQIPRML